MLFCAFVGTAWAQVLTVSNAPVDGEWDENTTWYIIKNKKGNYVSPSYVTGDYLMLNNTTKPEGDAALWCIVGNETDGYKFYNKSAGTDKILTGSGTLDAASDAMKMSSISGTDGLVTTFDIATSEKVGYFVVKDHGSDNNYWNKRGNYLAYWNSGWATNDDGSAFLFTTPEELANAFENLNNSLTEANAALTASGLQYTSTAVALQANTEGAAGYISCNNIDPQEGSDMGFLIDNDNNTYIHTNWHSVSQEKDYFEIYLGENNGLSLFQFSEVTRGGDAQSDFPASIEILGSTDGQNYTPIKTVSGLPTWAGASYTSPAIECDPSYIYLRFVVTGNYYAANRPYWHMAEFDLYSLELTINDEYEVARDEYSALYNGISAIQEVANNSSSDILQLTAASETLQEYMTAIDAIFNPEKYELINRIEELSSYLSCGGTTVGFIPEAKIATLSAAINAAQAIINNTESTADDYIIALEDLNIEFTGLDLANSVIMPEEGKYYSLHNAYSGIRMNVSATGGLISTGDGIGIGELFQFVPAQDGKFYLKSVERGTFLSTAPIHAGGQVNATATTIEEAKPVTISGLALENRVSITPDGGAPIHHDVSQSEIVGWNGDANSRSAWKIEEIGSEGKAHKVTITDAEWASLILGYDAIIPDGVKAYAVTAIGAEAATLTEITDAIPAGEAVLLNGAAGTYNFAIAESAAAVAGNKLEGTVFNTNIAKAAWILGIVDEEVGLYTVTLDQEEDTAFTNNAFKAYLPKTSTEGALRLEIGTTGIENAIVGENGNAAIFDLSGRRVAKMQKGIYIVNGKKVYVK